MSGLDSMNSKPLSVHSRLIYHTHGGIPQLEQDGKNRKGARINLQYQLLRDSQIIRDFTFIFLNQNKSGTHTHFLRKTGRIC